MNLQSNVLADFENVMLMIRSSANWAMKAHMFLAGEYS